MFTIFFLNIIVFAEYFMISQMASPRFMGDKGGSLGR